jgi:hypothetical protein
MSVAIIRHQGERPVFAKNVSHIHGGPGAWRRRRVLEFPLLSRRSGRTVRTPSPSGWPVAFIHRGGAAFVPEDTIPRFRKRLRYDEGVLERDKHSTIDGELVAVHDEEVDRTTDGVGPDNRKTSAEVARRDAGFRFTANQSATSSRSGKGVRVATLAEVSVEFSGLPVKVDNKRGGRPDNKERVAVDCRDGVIALGTSRLGGRRHLDRPPRGGSGGLRHSCRMRQGRAG